MKKKILLSIGIIAALVLVLNIAWFGWSGWKYSNYIGGMEKTIFSTFVTKRYAVTDEDGFTYAVKYPDYLSLTGNLSIGMPAEGDNPYTDALIIWPRFSGEYSYGLLLYDEIDAYQIEIDSQGNALDHTYDSVMEQHREHIDTLLEKTEAKWELK